MCQLLQELGICFKLSGSDSKERVKRVGADPGAIAFVATANLDGHVKPLTVDGEKADEDSVRRGRYVLLAPLILATTSQTSAAAQDFVGYLLSATGEMHSPGFIAARDGSIAGVAKP